MCGQADDVVWRLRPEDEAVPVILEPGLYLWLLESQKAVIDGELLEVRQEPFLCLGVALEAMGGVECLDLLLVSLVSHQTLPVLAPASSLGIVNDSFA